MSPCYTVEAIRAARNSPPLCSHQNNNNNNDELKRKLTPICIPLSKNLSLLKMFTCSFECLFIFSYSPPLDLYFHISLFDNITKNAFSKVAFLFVIHVIEVAVSYIFDCIRNLLHSCISLQHP